MKTWIKNDIQEMTLQNMRGNTMIEIRDVEIIIDSNLQAGTTTIHIRNQIREENRDLGRREEMKRLMQKYFRKIKENQRLEL